MCVPISLNRRAIGALAIDLKFKAERNFERSTKFLGVVASMIAQAVKIHRLIEEDKRHLVAQGLGIVGLVATTSRTWWAAAARCGRSSSRSRRSQGPTRPR